jgi:hypothetical protein
VDFLDELFAEKLPPRPKGPSGQHPLAARSDVLLLYGRCCLAEGSPRNVDKGRAALASALEVRQAFWGLRGSARDDLCLRPGVATWEAWLEDPAALWELAREFNDGGEPTLAVACGCAPFFSFVLLAARRF